MIAAFSTKDTDHPLKVWTRTLDEADEFYFELRTDIGTNKPIVLSRDTNKEEYSINSKSGFKIEAMSAELDCLQSRRIKFMTILVKLA